MWTGSRAAIPENSKRSSHFFKWERRFSGAESNVQNVLIKLDAYRRLGLANLFRAAWYKLRLKSGWLKTRLPIAPLAGGEFFAVPPENTRKGNSDLEPTSPIKLFGWHSLAADSPPHWHQSVLNGKVLDRADKHWSKIDDFQSGIGDIKGIWEPSRLAWSLAFADQYSQSGDPRWLKKNNQWLTDWCQHNAFNQGPNWKCAQETSIRLLHLAAANLILGENRLNTTSFDFVFSHLKRVAPTLGYAKAQDNNHGTSEAVAMFVGASWLLQKDPGNRLVSNWLRESQSYLEERVLRLIQPDGTFSQYSVVYHRMMLDTLCFAELWRVFLKLPAFPERVTDRVAAATRWLACFVDPVTGDAANLGANDGTHVLNLFGAEYRDFRYSAELASHLFLNASLFETIRGSVSRVSGVKPLLMLEVPDCHVLEDGGFARLANEDCWLVFNAPRYRFRPSQADVFHLDVWLNGINLLKDTGSYSYNTDGDILSYFNGAAGHNTIEFDCHDAMPKVSRFLFGCWPKAEFLNAVKDNEKREINSAYTGWRGHRHHRRIELGERMLRIVDEFSGVSKKAVLRWHLSDLDWQICNDGVCAEGVTIAITSTKELASLTVTEGDESIYYGKKQAGPMLCVESDQDARITTTINW